MKIPLHTNFLLVDDFESVGKTLEANLRDLGIHGQIYMANNVAEAKRCLEQYDIGAIISDKNMPGENGIDFLKHVRKHYKYEKTPFIMLTTSNEMESVLNAIDEGADNYIIKPWTLKDLKEKIDSAWLKYHPSIKAATSGAADS